MGTAGTMLTLIGCSISSSLSSSMWMWNGNRRMKEAPICKICMDNEVQVVLLPCSHLFSCVNCAHKLKNCLVCRQFIKRIVRTLMP